MFKSNQKFRKTTTYNGDYSVMPVTVTVLALKGEYDDGEPKWSVRFPESGKTYCVPECDLNPAPDAPETMSERFATLADGFESPLVACAAVDAICKLRDVIVADEVETLRQMEGSMFHGPAWIEAVKRAAEIMDPTKK